MEIMENNEMTFKILNDEGKEVECEILFTFDNTETEKSYIVYTDNTLDEEGNTSVYASVLGVDEEDNMMLLPIETEEEWDVVDYYLEKLQEEANREDEENEEKLVETEELIARLDEEIARLEAEIEAEKKNNK